MFKCNLCKKEFGNEYFEENVNEMVHDIFNIVNK